MLRFLGLEVAGVPGVVEFAAEDCRGRVSNVRGGVIWWVGLRILEAADLRLNLCGLWSYESLRICYAGYEFTEIA